MTHFIITMQTVDGHTQAEQGTMDCHMHAVSAEAARDSVVEYWLSLGVVGQVVGVRRAA